MEQSFGEKLIIFLTFLLLLFLAFTTGFPTEHGETALLAAASGKPTSASPEKPKLQKEPQDHERQRRLTGASDLEIRDIKVESKRGVKDTVHIFSNRFFTPSVFALEGERPRFVIDILNTPQVRIKQDLIRVGGDFIEQIRIRLNRGTGTLRVVLDLHPSKNYKLNQMFYEAENIYAVEVEEERNP
ncbi:MAG: AMIN domain-containing protein [Thermodesulfobacteriota bacterium]